MNDRTCARAARQPRARPSGSSRGASSDLLDIAEGGQAEVIGDRFEQAARAANRTAIAFAAESSDPSSPRHDLRAEDNSFENAGGAATFVRNHSHAPARLRGYRLPAGGVTPLRGPGGFQ